MLKRVQYTRYPTRHLRHRFMMIPMDIAKRLAPKLVRMPSEHLLPHHPFHRLVGQQGNGSKKSSNGLVREVVR